MPEMNHLPALSYVSNTDAVSNTLLRVLHNQFSIVEI
jgi:hypothetical protein